MEFKISINRSAKKENTPINSGAKTIPNFVSVSAMADMVGIASKNKFDINTKTKQGQQQAYDECPIVSSIISKRSQYSLNGIYKINDKYLNDIADSDVTKKMLIAPNPIQTIGEFQNQANIYRDVFGYCPIYKVYPANRTNGTPTAIYAVNPLWMDVVLSNKIISQQNISGVVDSITFKLLPNGDVTTLTGEQVNKIYFLKGRNSDKDNPIIMRSPLYDCADSINNYNIAFNVYGNLMQNSVMGIISNKGNADFNAMTAQMEKETVQSDIENNHGMVSGRNHFVITSANLTFQSLMANVSNLQLSESVKLSVNALCNKLGFSPELLADEQAKYENKKIAEIAHYQNETIPDANEYCRMLSEILLANITLDYSHVAVLQDNKKEKLDSFSVLINTLNTAIANGMMTTQEATELINSYKP